MKKVKCTLNEETFYARAATAIAPAKNTANGLFEPAAPVNVGAGGAELTPAGVEDLGGADDAGGADEAGGVDGAGGADEAGGGGEGL